MKALLDADEGRHFLVDWGVRTVCQGDQRAALSQEFRSLFPATGQRYGSNDFHPPSNVRARVSTELRFVVCSTESRERRVETCRYTGGWSLERFVVDWRIEVYDIHSRRILHTASFAGQSPEPCPTKAAFSTTAFVSRQLRGKPDPAMMRSWLNRTVWGDSRRHSQ